MRLQAVLVVLLAALSAQVRSEEGSIATGFAHSCRVTSSTGVECWGNGVNGQLGYGGLQKRFSPTPVPGLTGVQAVTAAGNHSCALTTSGAVWCWGSNSEGQIGDGSTATRLTPVPVTGLSSGVAEITAGSVHTCARLTAGTVQCWGRNMEGQLGDGSTTNRLSPVPVPGLSGVVALGAGGSHTCALETGGTVQCWGNNFFGQIGDGTTVTPRPSPLPVAGIGGSVDSIAVGGSHTCALLDTDTVRCWGKNAFGQLGDGSTTDSPFPVSVTGLAQTASLVAGGESTCAVDDAGAVQCWGRGGDGQLGNGAFVARSTPVPVTGLGSGVVAIASDEFHSCVTTTTGALQCWGSNIHGQIGDGTSSDRLVPVRVTNLSGTDAIATGANHACALSGSGGVQCWGENSEGQLGDGTLAPRMTAGSVPGLASSQALAAGQQHTCALTLGGAVLCWGNNTNGQLGDGTNVRQTAPTPVVGLGSGVQSIASGLTHTCAVTTGGAAMCWGNGASGRLGDGGIASSNTPVPVSGLGSGVQSIAAGATHTCAVTTSGAALCWGSNGSGQVGDATNTQRLTPVPVFGLGSGVQAISAGGNFTCAITSGGAAQCWGSNTNAQLGDGSFAPRVTPGPVTALGSGVLTISAGLMHTCAVITGGSARCWGASLNGAVGDGTTLTRSTPVPVVGLGSGTQSISASFGYACAVTVDGGVQCWGAGQDGQLGNIDVVASTPRAIVAGASAVVTTGVTLRGPDTADAGDLAGTSVAIGEDANNETLAMGAPGVATGGEVYLFVRARSRPTSDPSSAKAARAETFAKNIPPAVVLPPPPGGGIGDKFGAAVASSPDGNTIAVGAPSRGGSGAVYVFRKPAAGWDSGNIAPPVEILSPAPAGGVLPQGFGNKLAFAANGMLVVGAPLSDVGGATGAGAAFAYDDDGIAVTPIGGALTAMAPQQGAGFGASVAATEEIIAVGAPEENEDARTQQGAAYVYPVDAGGAVGAASRIAPIEGSIGDKFGTSVAVDGGLLVIGAPGDDTTAGTDSGSARLFKPDTGGVFVETSVLMPAPGNAQGAGSAVAVRGNNILIGAPLADAFEKPLTGRAYLYQLEDEQARASEAAVAVLENATPDAGDGFGSAVALGRKRLLLGVPDDSEPNDAGALQDDIGRTDTFILDRVLRAGFE